jgi:hypothetical protein
MVDAFISLFGSSGGGGGGQSIQGTQGTQGLQGPQGLQGLDGSFITQGVQGVQGTQGPQGLQGIQGEIGVQGTAVQGVQGIQGEIGIQGVQGVQGIQGIQGGQGLQGVQGLQGIQGIQGVPSFIQGSWVNASNTATLTASAINTPQPITWNASNTSTEFSFARTTNILTNDTLTCSSLNGVTCDWHLTGVITAFNGDVSNQTITIVPYVNGVAQTIGSQTITIQANCFEQILVDIIIQNTTPQSFQIYWEVTNLLVTIQSPVGSFYTTNNAIFNIYRLASSIQGAQGLQGRQGTQGLGAILRYASFSATAYTLTSANVYQYLPLFLRTNASTNDWSITNTTQLTGFFVVGLTNAPYILSATAQIQNTDSVPRNAFLIINVGGTDLSYTEVSIQIPANGFVVLPIEAIINVDTYIQIGFKSDSTLVRLVSNGGSAGLNANTYILGSTLQGVQGVQGIQGRQGLQGGGVQGLQGLQGAQGTAVQGLQGTQGVQGTAVQGIQGTQGIQGVQGTSAGINATSESAYYNADQTASASGTEQQILINTILSQTGDIVLASNVFRFATRGFYKVTCLLNLENTTGSSQKSWLYAKINGTAVSGTTTLVSAETGEIVQQLVEFIQEFQVSDLLDFGWVVSDVGLISNFVTASAPFPTGGANKVDIYLLPKVLDVKNSSAKLIWTTGYVNLTNGVDNQLPMNSFTEDGEALTSSNLSTSNSAIQILETGIYMVDTFSQLFDLGTNMTLSHTLYTSSDGTTWTFLTITALQRFTGTNTNQILNGSYRLNVTSLPFYIQMRMQPSANSPFPADFGAPTNLMITKLT